MEAKKKQRGGWTPKPFLEKKVQVQYTVKRKYWHEAMCEIKKVCAKYR